MKTNNKNNLFALTLVLLISFGFFFGSGGSSGGYLQTPINTYSDTVNTATTNDTSRIFSNKDGYTNLVVEYKQNSVSSFFKINQEGLSNFRVVYNASDSSFIVQSLGQAEIGWMGVPLLTQTSLTPVARFTGLTLRTGTGIIAFRGREE